MTGDRPESPHKVKFNGKSGGFGGRGKTVHAQRPLQANNGSLEAGQQPKAQSNGEWQPRGKVNPQRGLPRFFDNEHQWDHNVADGEDGEVGGRVIGPLVMQVFVTLCTGGVSCDIALVQLSLVALGAMPLEAAPHGA